jgi:hypothetical protein
MSLHPGLGDGPRLTKRSLGEVTLPRAWGSVRARTDTSERPGTHTHTQQQQLSASLEAEARKSRPIRISADSGFLPVRASSTAHHHLPSRRCTCSMQSTRTRQRSASPQRVRQSHAHAVRLRLQDSPQARVRAATRACGARARSCMPTARMRSARSSAEMD